MSYNEYIPTIINLIKDIENPKLLEIGIDKGQFFFPMVHNLIMTEKSFVFHDVDILVREEVKITSKYFMTYPKQIVRLIEQNSLEYLKDCREIYDVIMIDGDHNYLTVTSELEMINKNNSHNNTLIFCDDYSTKWGKKDLYYATRDEYTDNKLATQPQETELQGVGTAIDKFIEKNPEWKLYSFIQNGSVVLSKKELSL